MKRSWITVNWNETRNTFISITKDVYDKWIPCSLVGKFTSEKTRVIEETTYTYGLTTYIHLGVLLGKLELGKKILRFKDEEYRMGDKIGNFEILRSRKEKLSRQQNKISKFQIWYDLWETSNLI